MNGRTKSGKLTRASRRLIEMHTCNCRLGIIDRELEGRIRLILAGNEPTTDPVIETMVDTRTIDEKRLRLQEIITSRAR